MKNQSGKNMHFCKNGTQGRRSSRGLGQGVLMEFRANKKKNWLTIMLVSV